MSCSIRRQRSYQRQKTPLSPLCHLLFLNQSPGWLVPITAHSLYPGPEKVRLMIPWAQALRAGSSGSWCCADLRAGSRGRCSPATADSVRIAPAPRVPGFPEGEMSYSKRTPQCLPAQSHSQQFNSVFEIFVLKIQGKKYRLFFFFKQFLKDSMTRVVWEKMLLLGRIRGIKPDW